MYAVFMIFLLLNIARFLFHIEAAWQQTQTGLAYQAGQAERPHPGHHRLF
jgi:hypothetical protein